MSICFFKDFELKYFDVKGSVEFQQEDQGPVLQSWIRGLERQPGLTLGFQCHNSGSLTVTVVIYDVVTTMLHCGDGIGQVTSGAWVPPDMTLGI